MNSFTVRTAPLYPVRFVASTVLLALAVAVAASTFSLSVGDARGAKSDENAVSRCDRLAQSVADRLISAGIDMDTADFRRQRFSAFAACLDDPNNFEHRLGLTGHDGD